MRRTGPGQIQIVASLMCADLTSLACEVAALERAGVDGFHFDIMDGAFVPNLALSPMFVAALRSLTRLPFEAHLMMRDPRQFVEPLAKAGCDFCIIHLESEVRVFEAIGAIRRAGMIPGIAMNPTTCSSEAQHILGAVDRVLVMTVHPGFAGQSIVPYASERVAGISSLVSEVNSAAAIEVDGSINPATVGPLVSAGARILVGGSTGLFHGKGSFDDAIAELRTAAVVARKMMDPESPMR